MNRRRWKRKTTREILEAAKRAQSRAMRYARDAHELVALAIERWDVERLTMAARIVDLQGPVLPGFENGTPAIDTDVKGKELFDDMAKRLGSNVP